MYNAHRPWLRSVDPRSSARWEHAFLCRCEGESYKRIGERLGVGRQRAQHMVFEFSRILNWAMRRTKRPSNETASEDTRCHPVGGNEAIITTAGADNRV